MPKVSFRFSFVRTVLILTKSKTSVDLSMDFNTSGSISLDVIFANLLLSRVSKLMFILLIPASYNSSAILYKRVPLVDRNCSSMP